MLVHAFMETLLVRACDQTPQSEEYSGDEESSNSHCPASLNDYLHFDLGVESGRRGTGDSAGEAADDI
jgi:hypothetical protein